LPIDRLALVDRYGHFYRNNFRRLLFISFILVFIIALLLILIIYQDNTKPEQKYFVTTSDGRLIEITPAN